MKQSKILFLVCLQCTIVFEISAQKTDTISKDYDIEKMVGKWSGTGIGIRPNMPDVTISLQIELSRTSSPDTFQLSLLYSTDKKLRHHILYAKNKSKGEWIEDEKDSILNPHQFIGNRLTAFFKFGDAFSIVSDWVDNDVWYREEYGFESKPVYKTSDDLFRGYLILGKANFALKKIK
jgi:hypothetical protein